VPGPATGPIIWSVRPDAVQHYRRITFKNAVVNQLVAFKEMALVGYEVERQKIEAKKVEGGADGQEEVLRFHFGRLRCPTPIVEGAGALRGSRNVSAPVFADFLRKRKLIAKERGRGLGGVGPSINHAALGFGQSDPHRS
jgi:hypothetical protein